MWNTHISKLFHALCLKGTTVTFFKMSSSRSLSNVLIYKGEGAKEENVEQLFKQISRYVSPNKYNIKTISPKETKQGAWRSSTALYVIGGGYDLGFITALGDEGTIKIRDYVRTGGRYLGICAGAYFACDRIEFDKGGPQQVCGDRILKFFPGVCVGPVHGPYNYNIKVSARAVPLQFTDPHWNPKQSISLKGYFNGGGMFLPQDLFNKCSITRDPESYDQDLSDDVDDKIRQEIKDRHVLGVNAETGNKQVKNLNDQQTGTIKDILCHFSEVKGKPLAAITCKVGEGLAVLSAVHLEMDSPSLNKQDKFLQPIITQLSPYDGEQERCFGSLLHHAGLDILSS
ncbi:biotin--protein ligase-like [Mizuhopecten yessoensis]|uniref:Biotin--protein ligase n=1 Tax=Mizuhopecten yessoensis TaxID=6573 RepID=A0A210QAU4_MIZYE|nr:biotin--protein ligase-like [Mizuhopecten yessoensis]OWF45858.1 Biotin--protein ligase [Mizuhopecten yessoensis]